MSPDRDHLILYASMYSDARREKFVKKIKDMTGAEKTKELQSLIYNAFMDGMNLAVEVSDLSQVDPRFEDEPQ